MVHQAGRSQLLGVVRGARGVLPTFGLAVGGSGDGEHAGQRQSWPFACRCPTLNHLRFSLLPSTPPSLHFLAGPPQQGWGRHSKGGQNPLLGLRGATQPYKAGGGWEVLGNTPLRATHWRIPTDSRRGSEREVGQCVSAGVGPRAKTSPRRRGNGGSSKNSEQPPLPSDAMSPLPTFTPKPPALGQSQGAEHGLGGLGELHPCVSSARWWLLVAFWSRGRCAGA